jgi:glycosyltransferase involved in cell wall biosynthesis
MSGERDLTKTHYVVVIPGYNEEKRIEEVVKGCLRYIPDVLVIDDGSSDETAARAEEAGATVIRHEHNRGKGVALNTAFRAAHERKADVVITLDADGQHDPDELPKFIEAYERTGIPVLIGNRMADVETMPLIRRWTNQFMSWMLSRTMHQYIPDTQCGYRLYRSDIIPFVSTEAERFAAESEILLHIAGRNIRVDSVRVSTIYRDGNSKINPFRDTIRFFAMLHKARQTSKRKRRSG